MKLDLQDAITMQSEMLSALQDYMRVLELPNCNSCVKGLDICPGEGETLRINCPAYYDKKNGARPNATNNQMVENTDGLGLDNIVEQGVCEPAEMEAPEVVDDNWDAMNPPEPPKDNLDDEAVDATEENDSPKCPDDQKLLNYLRHGESEA